MANSKVFKGVDKTDTQVRLWPQNGAIEVTVPYKSDSGELKTYGASLSASTAEQMGVALIGYAARLREARRG